MYLPTLSFLIFIEFATHRIIVEGMSCYTCEGSDKACLKTDPGISQCPATASGCIVYITNSINFQGKGCAPAALMKCMPRAFKVNIEDGGCVTKTDITGKEWKSFNECIKDEDHKDAEENLGKFAKLVEDAHARDGEEDAHNSTEIISTTEATRPKRSMFVDPNEGHNAHQDNSLYQQGKYKWMGLDPEIFDDDEEWEDEEKHHAHTPDPRLGGRGIAIGGARKPKNKRMEMNIHKILMCYCATANCNTQAGLEVSPVAARSFSDDGVVLIPNWKCIPVLLLLKALL